MSKPVKVKLRNKKPLTHTGYVWESLLAQRGWNKLAPDDQYGLIDQRKVGCNLAQITFPACDIDLLLFSDEYEVIQEAA